MLIRETAELVTAVVMLSAAAIYLRRLFTNLRARSKVGAQLVNHP